MRAALVPLMLALTMLAFAQQNVTVRATADRTTLTTRDVASLSVEVVVEGGSPSDVEVGVEPVPGLQIRQLPNSNQSYTMINGKVTLRKIYQYRIEPERAGSYNLTGIKATVGGQLYRSNPVAITVAAAPALPPVAPPSGGTTVVPTVPGQEYPAHFMRATVEPGSAYIDQMVAVTYEIFTTAGRDDHPSFNPDQLNAQMFEGQGFTVYTHDFGQGPRRTYSYTTENLGGKDYLRIAVRRFLLFPLTAGEHHLPRAELTLDLDDRQRRSRDWWSGNIVYGRRQITLRSDPMDLSVKSLPEAGRPAGFDGAVGQFSVSANIDREAVHVGDPITLKVSIAGRGRVDRITTPEFGELPDFRQFDVTSDKDKPTVDGNGVTGAITFTYVLMPKNQDATKIPPLGFTYFDPVAGTYKTEETPEFALAVQAGGSPDEGLVGSAPYGGGRVSFGYENLDFRTIVNDPLRLGGAPGLLFARPVFWAAQGVPLVILLLGWGWRRRREALRRDPAGRRSRQAGARARARLAHAEREEETGAYYAALAHAVVGFISHRFRVEANGLTRPQLHEQLEGHGADEALAARVVETLDGWDRLRFAGGDAERRRDELDAARRLVGDLERVK